MSIGLVTYCIKFKHFQIFTNYVYRFITYAYFITHVMYVCIIYVVHII